jgi:hypothetical protein
MRSPILSQGTDNSIVWSEDAAQVHDESTKEEGEAKMQKELGKTWADLEGVSSKKETKSEMSRCQEKRHGLSKMSKIMSLYGLGLETDEEGCDTLRISL